MRKAKSNITGMVSNRVNKCDLEPSVGNATGSKTKCIPPKSSGLDAQDEGKTALVEKTFSECLDTECPFPARRKENSRRIKWTKEMNADVMRSYFSGNECKDDPTTGWRQRMFNEFKKRYPQLNITEQNLADRKSVICRKKYLTDTEIQEIKRECGNQIYQKDLFDELELAAIDQSKNDLNTTLNRHESPNTGPSEVSDLESIIREKFTEKLILYENSCPLSRPIIPKLKIQYDTANKIATMNIVLKKHLQDKTEIADTHLAVYCAAATLVELSGLQLKESRGKECFPKVRQQFEPKWKVRLNKKINYLRTKIGKITAHLKDRSNPKLIKELKPTLKKLRLNKKDHQYVEKLSDHLDILKQSLKATGARLHRYNQTTKRKEQNRLFQSNPRKFYRNLINKETSERNPYPDANNMKDFWQNIWSKPAHYDTKAAWLNLIKEDTDSICEMEPLLVKADDVHTAISSLPNWKSPGADRIHNFWWKKLTSVHNNLISHFNSILFEPEKAPHFFTTGITYMLQKDGNSVAPENYRPITCLPTIGKIFTSIIASKIYHHCDLNNIMAWEQKGCRKMAYGSKEQLIIDSIILQQARTRKRNLSMCYIDYKKAFDSVPHDWLLRVLEIYKIHPAIIHCLGTLMKHWKTSIIVPGTDPIDAEIKRGIFQGDSLSPLWFCLALNPLSSLLNKSNSGYKLNTHNKMQKITHLLYMDDIKIYSENKKQLHSLIETTKIFSQDIKMEFGYSKCAKLHIVKGKFESVFPTDEYIKNLEEHELYRYLGIKQNTGFNHQKLKKEFTEKYINRTTKILHTELKSRNLIQAINTWAIPILTYTFGILKWTDTDLNNLDRKTRTLLTKFRAHHPKACVERLYLHRKDGGRGLINIFQLCKSQEQNLKKYFQTSTTEMLNLITHEDKNLSILNLRECNNRPVQDYKKDMRIKWKTKILHGQYPASLEVQDIEKEQSVQFLRKGYLFPETEGFITAIQDKAIATKNHEKHILKTRQEDFCRKCKTSPETIEHIISGCPELSQNYYLNRHNQVAKLIHQQLALKHNIVTNPPPYFKYTPNPVIENSDFTLYWDKTIITDKTVDYNRPDIVLVDKKNSSTTLIDIAVPLTHNIAKTENEKIRKYENLAMEIKRIWKQNEVRVVPVVMSATGAVSSTFNQSLRDIGLSENLLHPIQKAVILQTCHITRKFLNQKA